MNRPNVILPGKVAEPMFLESQDDFVLLLMSIIDSIVYFRSYTSHRNQELKDFLIMSFKIVNHEYLAAVLSEKIKPYEFSKEFVESEKESFRRVMLEAKAKAMECGVPMKEVDGKFKLDYDALGRQNG